MVSESIPKAPRQYPLLSAPSIPQRVQVKNLPVPEADLDGEPSSAFVGSEPEADVPEVAEVDGEPLTTADDVPEEEVVAETFVVVVGLLMPCTPDW